MAGSGVEIAGQNFTDTQAPYDAVVEITATMPNGVFTASGVLVAPDEVLTVSHIVWQAGVGSASSVTVTPALQGSDSPFGSAAIADYHYFPVNDANDLITETSSQDDVSLLHLSQPITAPTPMEIGRDFFGGAVTLSGYPERFGNADTMVGETLQTQANTLDVLDFNSILGPGSSGGPLWTTDANGNAEVVGVLSTGGWGAQITSPMYQQIWTWEAADHSGAALALANATPVNPTFNYIQNATNSATLSGAATGDVLFGAGNNQWLVAGAGNEDLVATGTNATLFGSAGSDSLQGGPGTDIVVAGSGASSLFTGGGDALFVSGAGADQFFIDPAQISSVAAISGFNPAKGDHIDLAPLANSPFQTAAAAASQQIDSNGSTFLYLGSVGTQAKWLILIGDPHLDTSAITIT